MRKLTLMGAAAVCAMNPVATAAQDTDTPTLLAYLGLSAADGKTTVGDNAAAVEATMLVSALAMATATIIKQQIGTQPQDQQIVLLTKDEKFSLMPYRQAMALLETLEKREREIQLEVARKPCQSTAADRGGTKSITGDPGLTDSPSFKLKPSDFIGAIQTSTALTAASVDPGVELLKAALSASSETLLWSSPSDVMDTQETQALLERANGVQERVRPYAGKNCPNNEEVGKVADAILASTGSLTFSKEGAPSLIDRAAAVATFGKSKNTKILRLEVAKAGGTLVNTSNIWTSIGIPGLAMRGGMVTSYRLVDPNTGRTDKAGIVTCRYPNQLLLRINERSPVPAGAECDLIDSASPVKPAGMTRAR